MCTQNNSKKIAHLKRVNICELIKCVKQTYLNGRIQINIRNHDFQIYVKYNLIHFSYIIYTK